MEKLICDAIHNRQTLRFEYDGLPRLVEPHKLGRTTRGNDVVCGDQTGGSSRSDTTPYWRLFQVSKITGLTIQDDRFPGPRPGYNPADRRIPQDFCRL